MLSHYNNMLILSRQPVLLYTLPLKLQNILGQSSVTSCIHILRTNIVLFKKTMFLKLDVILGRLNLLLLQFSRTIMELLPMTQRSNFFHVVWRLLSLHKKLSLNSLRTWRSQLTMQHHKNTALELHHVQV